MFVFGFADILLSGDRLYFFAIYCVVGTIGNQKWPQYVRHISNISLLGIVRKLTGCSFYSDLWLIIPGLILFFIPYFRIQQYKYLRFRLMLLANVLLYVVLFSTGSEASGYITLMIGVAIWYICSPSVHKRYNRYLFFTTLIFVALCSTELVPPGIRHHIIGPYALKAWPCTIVCFTICYEMIF